MTDAPPTRSQRRLQLINILLGITGIVAYAVSMFTSGAVSVVITVIGLLGFVLTLGLLIRRRKHLGPIVKSTVISLLAVVAGSYLILFLLIFFFQDTIANQTSSFFQPKAISPEAAQALAASDVEAIDLPTPDGARLRGWLVKNSMEAQTPLLIFFNGSGSESSARIPFARKLDGWSVALINYRGFGQSEGTPSQANAFADATFIYDTLIQRPDIDPNRVVAMGYSLGTAIATYLSEQRPVAGTVLVAPYDNLTLIGTKRPPLYAPLMGIMNVYFDSISRAPGIKTPLLVLVGEADSVFPPELSQKLAGQWGGAAEVKTYPGEDHDLLLHHNSSWADISAFLQTLGQP
jgi:pimeloyl-ACP methyl ester carboxylesterase